MEFDILELFSGTKSISSAFKRFGCQTFTVDNDKNLNPDLCVDILSLDLSSLPKASKSLLVIWASPPCQTFSVASIPHYWIYKNGQHIPKNEKSETGLKLLDKTIEIITRLNPQFWYIENPRGIMRKKIDEIFSRHNITGYTRKTVTYCQYGDKRQKPTDIWTNNYKWTPRPPCDPGSSCHELSPRSVKNKGTQGLKNAKERGKIPRALCNEIVKSSISRYNTTYPEQKKISVYL